MSEDLLLQCMHEAAAGYVSPLILMLSLQTIVLISLNRCGRIEQKLEGGKIVMNHDFKLAT